MESPQTRAPDIDPPKAAGSKSRVVSPVLIARRAFQIWESEGKPESSSQCWARAEAEFRNPRG